MHKGHQLCKSQKDDYKVMWPRLWPMKHLTAAIKVENSPHSPLQWCGMAGGAALSPLEAVKHSLAAEACCTPLAQDLGKIVG